MSTDKKPETIIVLDTETTGLDHKTEKIIEIAAVKLVDGQTTETFSSLVNPQQPIRHSSFLVHGITEEMVSSAPPIDEVLPKFLEFCEDNSFVAHNAIFDYSFINEAMKATYGKRFENPRIDTFEMYRSVFPDEQSHSLSSLLARFGFDSFVSHRALDDAANLAKVYPQLRQLYEQKYQWQLSQLPNIEYLVERYLRLQKASQTLQAEMGDLKDIFKLYFENGGRPVTASSGETMVSSYRRSYTYDEDRAWQILLEAGLHSRVFKLNPRALDKLMDRGNITPEQRELLLGIRTQMNETRQVNFLKPQAPTESSSSADNGEKSGGEEASVGSSSASEE